MLQEFDYEKTEKGRWWERIEFHAQGPGKKMVEVIQKKRDSQRTFKEKQMAEIWALIALTKEDLECSLKIKHTCICIYSTPCVSDVSQAGVCL